MELVAIARIQVLKFVPSPNNNRVIKIKHDEIDCSCRRQDRSETHIYHHHHHHHHVSVMGLGHLSTRSCLTYPEFSKKVYRDSFCQLGSSVSLPWVIYFEAFYLHVVFSFSCIPVIFPKLVLFLNPLQFVHLFCNLSKCIRDSDA